MEHQEQAMSLLLVKEALGEFYDEQKNMYLDTILGLPMKEAAAALNSFVEIGFITKEELNENVKKLFAKARAAAPTPTTTPPSNPSPSPSPQVAAPTATDPNSNSNSTSNSNSNSTTNTATATATAPAVAWREEPTLQTKIAAIQHHLSLLAAINEKDMATLLESLAQLNVTNVEEVLQTDKNNDKFHFLDDLMAPAVYQNFKKVVNVLMGLSCAQASGDAGAANIQTAAQRNAEVVPTNVIHHMWTNTAQLLVFPLRNKYHFYCSVESPQTEATLEKGEQLFFVLDVSASMNHDEKGKYCAPKSPDHPASSIKKARDLIPTLAVPALKRNVTVTVVIWNYKIKNVIEFTPLSFQDPETGVFQDDSRIITHIKQQTNEGVFTARGGTNIEAALKEVATRMKGIASKVAQISVWFLTDGEETVYLQPDGGYERVPTNQNQANFLYFSEENEEGTTAYQRKLIKDLVTARDELRSQQCYMQFHACHFGEAHPLFLKALATAVDGHFHTFVDVANVARELNANTVASTAQVTIIGQEGARPEVFPAALSEGYLCCRGEVSQDTFDAISSRHKPILRTVATGDIVLDMNIVTEFSDRVRESVSSIFLLEKDLERVLQATSQDVKMVKLNESSNHLRDLRQRRGECVLNMPREVRSNAMLNALLEKVLESVETQMESFTRLLEQFIKEEQNKYDKAAVAKNDMFTTREQMAISANVESMRVQMGKGFVSKTCLDKQIQRLVAANGPRAMRMLERSCLIAETVRGDITLLTLFIVEGRDLKGWRSQHVTTAVTANGFTDPKYTSKYYEVLRHDDANQVVADTRVTVHEGPTLVKEIKETIPIKAIYPRVVETYHCSPKTDDLDDACKRMLDPLSYSHFLDLIRENNTLPAFLYTITQTQSPGLLFNAKEMLYVKSGGSDSTSVDYFRLFWKLAAKDGDKCVKVPGTFAPANVCLPIAPEPLTNTVLSCLMPGLLSEFITGTSMAPLPGIIDLYVGFLNLHMRGKHTGLDISRIGEILSTMRVWIDNPNTNPKPETFREMLDGLVKDQGIAPANSSGKIMPVKAFAYAMVDEVYPAHVKFSALYKETLKRYTRHFFIPSSELNKNPKLTENVAKNQTGLTEFFKQLVGAIADDDQVVDDIPVGYLSSAHRLSALVLANNPKDVIEFLDNPRHTHAIAAAVWRALGEKTSAAYGDSRSWCGTQRMFAVWLCAATYPIRELSNCFAAFRAPIAFEAHFAKMLRRVVGPENSFDHVLFEWVVEKSQGDENVPGLMALEFRNEALYVRDTEFNVTPLFDCEPTIRHQFLAKLWELFYPILNMWYWKHKPGSAYNLLDLDYDLVRALRDPTLIASLNQVQCSELNAIREYKNPLYFKYIPPKPAEVTLSQEARYAASQAAKSISGKSRISIIFIGSGNCGKSTIAGHMLHKRGIIDERTMRQYKSASNQMGKTGVEFAWILNRLRQERERGCSIETHSWCLESNQYEVDILDAPGHSDFIKNMMVGASLADVAILIVSAADGEFESGITRGGMTREEALVAYATGIRRFIVLVTKMELKNYSASRFEEISLAVTTLFKQIGLSSHVPVIPVSGLVGDNLVEPSANIPWYTGVPRTLLEALDTIEPPQRMYDGPLRVPILRTYKIGGVGTVAVGRVMSGMVSRGDEVVLAPSNITAQVKSIEMYKTDRKAALPGDVIAFSLKGVTMKDVPRGLVAVPPGKYPRIASFIALVAIIDHPTAIHEGYTPFVCVHTRTVACKFIKIIEKIEKQTGTVIEANPKSLRKGDAAHVELQPIADIFVEPVSKCPSLARFVMRDGHGTVAIGVVKSIVEAVAAPPKLPSAKGKRR